MRTREGGSLRWQIDPRQGPDQITLRWENSRVSAMVPRSTDGETSRAVQDRRHRSSAGAVNAPCIAVAHHRRTLDELSSVFRDDVREVLEFGVLNQTAVTGSLGRRLLEGYTPAFLIRWLGVVGNRKTARLLEQFVDNPDLGPHAVAALRRLTGSSGLSNPDDV
jgi:hypothetical protein